MTTQAYNCATMPIDQSKLEAITGVQKIDFPALLESVKEESNLSKADMAEKLGITVRAYEMLTDTKKEKRPKPSVETFINLLLIRAEKRGVNLKALFL